MSALESLTPADTRFLSTHSQQDASINWIRPTEVGYLEARYVRRVDDYVVVYLSSQTGCRQGCRMCHLTATGQTKTRDASVEEILEQADVVLDFYRREAPRANVVHFNFMARGEPLASEVVTSSADRLLGELGERAVSLGLKPRFLFSTILPKALGERALQDIFVLHQPEIYYSIYSTREDFRRRWLPSALPVSDALDRLASWQRHSYKLVKIHYAFIEGENDSEADVHAVCDALNERKIAAHVNIVRYNPPTDRHGRESGEDILARNAKIFAERLPLARVRVIPRVGFDVAASCGMFLAP